MKKIEKEKMITPQWNLEEQDSIIIPPLNVETNSVVPEIQVKQHKQLWVPDRDESFSKWNQGDSVVLTTENNNMENEEIILVQSSAKKPVNRYDLDSPAKIQLPTYKLSSIKQLEEDVQIFER